MTIDKPLMTEKEEQEFKRQLPKFYKAIKSTSLSAADRKLIEQGAEWLVYRMTMKKHRNELADLQAQVLRDFSLRAKGGAGREELLKHVAAKATDLLDNNFYVRFNAVRLLAQLNLEEGDTRRDQPPVAYTPAFEPLLQVVQSEDQHQGIKVAAVNGLARIAELGNLTNSQRIELAKILVGELKRSNLNPWYQWKLVGALGTVGVAVDPRDSRPFVVTTLGTVMSDQTANWLVRCEAARSLGRLRLPGNLKSEVIAYQMAVLGYQMAQAYNKNANAFDHYRCFHYLYTGFDGGVNSRRGLLENFSASSQVKEAFQHLLPVIQHVAQAERPAPIPENALKALADWLEKNPPENYSLAPNEPPIVQRPTSSKKESKSGETSPADEAASSKLVGVDE